MLTGYSPKLDVAPLRFSWEVLWASLAGQPPVRPVQAFHLTTSSSRLGPSMGFLEAEELGIGPAAECNMCRGCRDCSFRRKLLSPHDNQILRRIEKEMIRDPVMGRITASYPWKPCKERMKDNRAKVEKLQARTEASMIRDRTHEEYLVEMMKAFASRAVRELQSEELLNQEEPVHSV